MRPRVPRALVAIALVLAMWAFGVGVYQTAGYLKANHARVQKPTQTAGLVLPGTIFVVQSGAIYRYEGGRFSQITSESGWTQPAINPTGSSLIAVRRQPNRTDLYLLNTYGRVETKLTDDGSSVVEDNHWAFYPRFTPGGSQILFDFDPKDPYNSYRVDLAIFASPAYPSAAGWVQWTYPNYYTGGDVTPVPLRGGGLIYTKFSIDDQSKVHSQVWYQARVGDAGTALTDPAADCLQPALSADEREVAMVCTNGPPQTAELRWATFNPATLTLGTPTVLVKDGLVASPSFAPDGKTIAYLAPAEPGGGFQLWTVMVARSASPSPVEISSTLDLDATSAPVWTT